MSSPPVESVRDMVVRFAQKFEGPNDIAQAILAELSVSPDSMRRAFAEILPDYCATVLRAQRLKMGRLDVSPDVDDGDDSPQANSARSAKLDGIRAWHTQFLAQQLHVDGCWKRFGDCTVADLNYGALERESQAASTMRRARELKEIAAALVSAKKRRVADLPADVLRAALERAK